jgi:KaiC/GvpD/RAD55 family RecA-like ATPase
MPIGTGNDVLDEMLRGGLPAAQPVLVTGGPGTGKTTLAMQFLQEGLDAGENCVYISTEQTADDLEQAFDSFEFDLDHENLEIASVHATPGKTLESDEEQLTLATLSDDEEGLGGGFTAPFTSEYVEQYIRRFAPCERIVFDSVSGLRAMSDDVSEFRRSAIDLMRLFSDEFEANSLLVSEEHEAGGPGGPGQLSGDDAIRYNAHGVLRLWREEVDGELQRFLQIHKMRGVDHDTRKYLVQIGATGVDIVPRNRTPMFELSEGGYLSTGIDGLDNLLSGGLLRGSTAVMEHDGRADRQVIVNTILAQAYDEDWSMAYVPPTDSNPKQVAELFADTIAPMEDLLEEDRLFILDMTGVFDAEKRNVFSMGQESNPNSQSAGIMGVMDNFVKIDDRREDRPLLYVANTKSMLNQLEVPDIKSLRQWALANVFGPDDAMFYVHNPELLPGTLGPYFIDEATQVLKTRLRYGMQFIKLDKAPTSNLGSNRYVEYVDEEPFIRVQHIEDR